MKDVEFEKLMNKLDSLYFEIDVVVKTLNVLIENQKKFFEFVENSSKERVKNEN